MESAIFGLLGVVVGAILTVAKEWWFQRRRDQKDAEYLAVLVVFHLERFANGCAAVVGDDGLPDKDGFNTTQVLTPKFDTELLKVEWRSLPATLMYEILDLPYREEMANHRVDDAFEFAATPPDFGEGFEERQYQYASLGIDASLLAGKLRKHAGLPFRRKGEWNPVDFMEEQKAKIQSRRKVSVVFPSP